MPVNFQYFALHYLDDWLNNDRRFVAGLYPGREGSTRLTTLQSAAVYYGVSRTLKTLPEGTRLAAALAALDAVPPVTDDGAVDAAVETLARALQARYGKYAVSAASKFLWLRDRSPIVILDSQAAASLWANDRTRTWSDYAGYRRAWLAQFDAGLPAIRVACDAVPAVKRFSLACDVPDATIAEWTSARWFHERVFDKFLWWTAGPAEAPAHANDVDRPDAHAAS